MFDLLIAVLATFGVAALVANYDGLGDVFLKLKSRFAVARCTVCLSVWVAVPVCIGLGLGVFEYLCIIGSVIIIERLT